MFEYLVSTWWNCLGRIRRCDLVGGSVSLGAHFEVSKDHARRSQCTTLFPACGRPELSVTPVAVPLCPSRGL